MSKIANIVVLSVSSFQSLMIFIGNTFTIFVFWIHRHKLKRASFLLINLAVADLLVGFTEILTVGSCSLPREIGTFNISKTCDENISAVFQIAFSGTSIFFRTYFAGASIRVDLAASPSSNKHQNIHLQCCHCDG